MTSNQEPIIVSIPHTGSRFLKERFSLSRILHTSNVPWEDLLEETEGRVIIAPLRDPKDTWISHTRRWVTKDLPFDPVLFVSAWYMMHALTLVREIDFIPVDLQEDPRITDWTPVGTRDRGKATHPAIDLRYIYELPFVARYYGRK